ncbi:MAG: hypothetical protein RIA72_06425 [Sphingopyxis sp.]|uniref:hypothetical protein n=1 Tax=Sphingopyxis sp. TaxID=1908224 RepID=UPI0032EB0FFB
MDGDERQDHADDDEEQPRRLTANRFAQIGMREVDGEDDLDLPDDPCKMKKVWHSRDDDEWFEAKAQFAVIIGERFAV